MEVLLGAPSNETWIECAATEPEGKLTETNQEPLQQVESKKRGVYVEKWGTSKQISIEDNKTQPRMRIKTKPREIPKKLLTAAPTESKIATSTRLLGTADPPVRSKKRKTQKRPSTKRISQQNSKLSNESPSSQPKDVKPGRNIIEENKKNVKNMKFRSSTLREVYSKKSEKTISYKNRKDIVLTPSDCSKVTQDLSDHANWSKIFPTDRQNVGKNLLQQYICNEQGAKTLNVNKLTDKKSSTHGGGKKEPIYDFFIDLLESVYDEDLINAGEGSSHKSSDVKFDIDDNVAQKLNKHQSTTYTIKDEISEPFNQMQQLADYYNSRNSLVPQKRRRRKPVNQSFPYFPPVKEERKKRKKPNLLSILKQQLSMDYHVQQQPANMYEALLTIAKKNKKRRVYIDSSKKDPSEPDGACRFKRRNVISPSTRLPKKNVQSKAYSVNATRDKYRSDTTSESSHSLEVVGYDYDDEGMKRVETDYSDSDGPKSRNHRLIRDTTHGRNIVSLNEDVKTVTHYWKSDSV